MRNCSCVFSDYRQRTVLARHSKIRLAFVQQFFCRRSFMKKAEAVPISLFTLNRMTNKAEKSKK